MALPLLNNDPKLRDEIEASGTTRRSLLRSVASTITRDALSAINPLANHSSSSLLNLNVQRLEAGNDNVQPSEQSANIRPQSNDAPPPITRADSPSSNVIPIRDREVTGARSIELLQAISTGIVNTNSNLIRIERQVNGMVTLLGSIDQFNRQNKQLLDRKEEKDNFLDAPKSNINRNSSSTNSGTNPLLENRAAQAAGGLFSGLGLPDVDIDIGDGRRRNRNSANPRPARTGGSRISGAASRAGAAIAGAGSALADLIRPTAPVSNTPASPRPTTGAPAVRPTVPNAGMSTAARVGMGARAAVSGAVRFLGPLGLAVGAAQLGYEAMGGDEAMAAGQAAQAERSAELRRADSNNTGVQQSEAFAAPVIQNAMPPEPGAVPATLTGSQRVRVTRMRENLISLRRLYEQAQSEEQKADIRTQYNEASETYVSTVQRLTNERLSVAPLPGPSSAANPTPPASAAPTPATPPAVAPLAPPVVAPQQAPNISIAPQPAAPAPEIVVPPPAPASVPSMENGAEMSAVQASNAALIVPQSSRIAPQNLGGMGRQIERLSLERVERTERERAQRFQGAPAQPAPQVQVVSPPPAAAPRQTRSPAVTPSFPDYSTFGANR